MTDVRWTPEQVRAIQSTDDTLLVANAGTGKTTTVVGKILWHLGMPFGTAEDTGAELSIAELEQHGRGLYTGSMGYISRDGQMNLNILIRSMLLSGRDISLRTGAGIVMDSIAERELAETVAKARGRLLAVEAGTAYV